MRLLSAVVATAVVLSSVHPAWAQAPAPAAPAPAAPAPAPANPPAPAAPTAGAPSAAPTPAAVEEAKQRYKRALELFDEGSFDAAQLEMRRAYALAPSYRMLYNLGLISVQLNDYAAALEFFQRYLSEGGAEVAADRVTDVEQRMERLRGRVGFLRIETNVPAEITVDDVAVGQTPLAKPIRVNAGRRRVGARVQGRIPDNKVVEVAGGDNAQVTLNLVDPRIVTVAGPGAPTTPPRPEMWIAWGATAALAAGTVVFSILALSANEDYKTRRGTFGVTSGELTDADHKARGLSLTADLLGVGTILAGGLAVYFTVRPKTEARAKDPGPSTPAPKPSDGDAAFFIRGGASQVFAGSTF